MRKVRKVRILSPNGTIIFQISQNSHNSYLINENDYFSMQNLHETVEIVETVGKPINRRNLTEVSQESQESQCKNNIMVIGYRITR